MSRQGESTGFFRQSIDQPGAMSYYIVVEPVAPGGRILKVPITSIETQKTDRVSIWAQRVAKETSDRIAAEKASSGVVSNDILGHKTRGELKPTVDDPTPGGAITNWDD